MEAEQPLEIYAAHVTPMAADRQIVELSGRWRRRVRRVREPAVLVVEHDGRQHRFPERDPPQDGRRPRAGASWSASFILPTWLEAHLEGQTWLKLAELTLALPAGSFGRSQVSIRHEAPSAALLEAQELLAQARELRARLQARQA
jgi:hypothetical protein